MLRYYIENYYIISGFGIKSSKDIKEALYKAAEKSDLYVEEKQDFYSKYSRLTFLHRGRFSWSAGFI